MYKKKRKSPFDQKVDVEFVVNGRSTKYYGIDRVYVQEVKESFKYLSRK